MGSNKHMNSQKPKQKRLVITVLIILSVILAVVINIVTGMDIVYTHFFYLPIVATGIWYYKAAIWVDLLLGAMHVGINFALHEAIVPSTIYRGLVFCVVAYAVSHLSRKKEQALIIFQEYMKARDIISKMIPQELPATEKVSFAAHYQPAEQIGGDYFNVIRVGNKLVICMADASGHAMDGSILSFYINAMMNAFLSFQKERGACVTPKAILQYLAEQYDRENYPHEYMVCIFVAVYDLDSGIFSYAGAGYQASPFLALPGGELRELTAWGLPLSSALPLAAINYKEESFTLQGNATILLFTDGLSEQMTETGIYGDRIKEVFQENCHLPPEQIIKAIKSDFMHCNKSLQGEDDITMLVMQVADPE